MKTYKIDDADFPKLVDVEPAFKINLLKHNPLKAPLEPIVAKLQPQKMDPLVLALPAGLT